MANINPVYDNSREVNGNDFVYEEDLECDFEVIKVDITEKQKTMDTVEYISKWHQRGGLDIKQRQKPESSYARRCAAGLFFTLFNKTLFNCVRKQTSQVMVNRGLLESLHTSKGKVFRILGF